MITYQYIIVGTARHGQTWLTRGTVAVETVGQFDDAVREALTEGRAIYEHPEISCQGPYQITKLTIERVEPETPHR